MLTHISPIGLRIKQITLFGSETLPVDHKAWHSRNRNKCCSIFFTKLAIAAEQKQINDTEIYISVFRRIDRSFLHSISIN